MDSHFITGAVGPEHPSSLIYKEIWHCSSSTTLFFTLKSNPDLHFGRGPAAHPGRSVRAPEPRVRAFSKPYGKRGAQSNHVAAEPRPGGNAWNARRGPALLPSQGLGSRSARSHLPSLPGPAAPQPQAPSNAQGPVEPRRSVPARLADGERPVPPLKPHAPRIPQWVQTRVLPPGPTALG